MEKTYLNPTQESGRLLVRRNIKGKIIMLNMLKFREFADYSQNPTLKPSHSISGEEAYQLYMKETLPHLLKSGGEIMFYGKGGPFLIGPSNETWDSILIIRQNSVEDFMAFASNQEYLKGIGHRIAALEDSRLLPLVEDNTNLNLL